MTSSNLSSRDLRAALETLRSVPALSLGQLPTPIEPLDRLRAHLGGGPCLVAKRDDLIGFGVGGNKVRKLALVAARARREGCDTLVTTGGLQSNHARVTASVAARLGMQCALVLNGAPPERPTGNLRLALLAGASVHYVDTRDERSPAMGALVEQLLDHGRRPFMIPLGASTALGATAYVRAVGELTAQMPAPDVIVHASSSGGTQAGLVAGCLLHGLPTRVIGVSADERSAALGRHVRGLLEQVGAMLGLGDLLARESVIEVDDGFVGGGYGVPTDASTEALGVVARTEGMFLDPTYTAKAMAALLAYVRSGRFKDEETVVFWHTGGLPGLLA